MKNRYLRCARWIAAASAIVIWASQPASADTIYSSQALFLADVGAVGFESFEGLAVTGSPPPTTGLLALLSAFSLTATPRAGVFNQADYAGTHATDGTKYVEVENDPSNTNIPLIMTFTFGSPITAFGVTISDFGDFGSTPLSYGTNSAVPGSGTAAPTPGLNANDRFFGIIATGNPFTTLTLSTPSGTFGDPFSVDSVYYSVPDAGSAAALLSVAVAALASVRRLK